MTRLLTLAATTVGLLLTGRALTAAEKVDYVREVKPLLTARCYACHGALQQKGGLRLDTAELAREGGGTGPAVEPGKGADILLVARVVGKPGHKRMPPASEGETLSEAQVALRAPQPHGLGPNLIGQRFDPSQRASVWLSNNDRDLTGPQIK